MQEFLLSRALPQPSASEVVRNPARTWMILGTASSKMLDAFLEYFERRFQVYPVALYHAQWAFNALPLTPGQKDILGSLISVKSPTAMSDGRFIGSEFLTWLWFYIERLGGSVQAGDNRQPTSTWGSAWSWCSRAMGKERVICTTQANFLHEARTALRQGKVADETQLLFIIGENEHRLRMDSSLWAVKGLETPKQLPDYGQEYPTADSLKRCILLRKYSQPWMRSSCAFLRKG